MKNLVSIALGLLVFLGSAGIPLYQHTCSMEDVTIRTLFTSSDHCDEAEKEALVHKLCCNEGALKTNEQLKKEPCCKDYVRRLTLGFAFFQQWQFTAAVVPQEPVSVLPFIPYTIIHPADARLQYAANSDPPPLSGRERLCAICILRL